MNISRIIALISLVGAGILVLVGASKPPGGPPASKGRALPSRPVKKDTASTSAAAVNALASAATPKPPETKSASVSTSTPAPIAGPSGTTVPKPSTPTTTTTTTTAAANPPPTRVASLIGKFEPPTAQRSSSSPTGTGKSQLPSKSTTAVGTPPNKPLNAPIRVKTDVTSAKAARATTLKATEMLSSPAGKPITRPSPVELKDSKTSKPMTTPSTAPPTPSALATDSSQIVTEDESKEKLQVVASEAPRLSNLGSAAVPLIDWVQRKYAKDVGIDSLGASMTVLAYKLVHFFDSFEAAREGLNEMTALNNIQSADHKIIELLRQPIIDKKPFGTLMDLVITSLKNVEFPNKLESAEYQFMSRIGKLSGGQLDGPTDVVPMEVRAVCGIVGLIRYIRYVEFRMKNVSELLPVLLIKDVPDTLDRLGLWPELTLCISKEIIHRKYPYILSKIMAVMHGMSSKQEDLLKILKDSFLGLMKVGYSDDTCGYYMLSDAVKPAGTFWSLRPDLMTEVVKLCPVTWISSVDNLYSAVTNGYTMDWEKQVYHSKDGNVAIKCILQSRGYRSSDAPYYTANGTLGAGKFDDLFYMLTPDMVCKSTGPSTFSDIHVGTVFGFRYEFDDDNSETLNRAHRYLFGDLKNSGLGLFAAYIERISVYQVVLREPFKQQIEQSFKDAVLPDDKS